MAAKVSAVRTKNSPTDRIGLATTAVLTRASTRDSCPAQSTAAEHDELHSTRDEWIGSLWAQSGTVDTCPCDTGTTFQQPSDGLSERTVSPVRYPSTSAPRPRPRPAHRTTRYCTQGFRIIASRTAPRSPGRSFRAASVSSFCTADSPRGQLSLTIDVQRSPHSAAYQAVSGRHGRCPRRDGSAQCRRRECESRAVRTSATDCDSRSGPTTTSSNRDDSNSGVQLPDRHRRTSTSRCADLWEKPSASRTLDTPLREEQRDSAQFRTTVGDPDPS